MAPNILYLVSFYFFDLSNNRNEKKIGVIAVDLDEAIQKTEESFSNQDFRVFKITEIINTGITQTIG